MKPLLYLAIFLSSTALQAEDKEVAAKPEPVPATTGGPSKTKSFTFDCEAWAEGVPPKDVFVVDGTVKVATKDGGKVIMIDPSPIVDASAQFGDSSNGSASIEAKVFGSKRARSYPRFGVSVHGMSGYRLIVNCAKKELELIKNETVVKTVPFVWTTDTWTKLKIEAKQDGKKWTVACKAWNADATEPAAPLITAEDDTIKGQGKAAIWGTPFSELPLYFDDIKVEATSK